MKFIHIADVHLDKKIINLGNFADSRRMQYIETFREILKYATNNKIDYIFIAGDFYEHKYIKKSTINMIVEAFKKCTSEIYITPGNHDPYIKNSVYDTVEFPKNVHIIKGYYQEERSDVNIYAYGFTDFYDDGCDLNKFKIYNNDKLNIFISHADIYNQSPYNPIDYNMLKKKNFDYSALGHIHTSNFKDETNIIYPGSMMQSTYMEEDTHGYIVIGEEKLYNKGENKFTLTHKKVDNQIFKVLDFDITNIDTKEEILDKLNEKLKNFEINNVDYIKIRLIGKKRINILLKYLLDNIFSSKVTEIEDRTTIYQDLDVISKEHSVKGIAIKKLVELKKNYLENNEKILKNFPKFINIKTLKDLNREIDILDLKIKSLYDKIEKNSEKNSEKNFEKDSEKNVENSINCQIENQINLNKEIKKNIEKYFENNLNIQKIEKAIIIILERFSSENFKEKAYKI